MTRKQYNFCVTKAANYADPDAYVSSMLAESIWGDANGAEFPTEFQETLRSIYTAATRTVREIIATAGMTQAAFSAQFCVPLRTVENWCTGCRECPLYTRLLIQQCMGMFVPPIE